jgi:hypothetical protein
MPHSYTRELEFLIIDKLLPAYIREQQAKGNKTPTKDINPALLVQLSRDCKLPALLRAY